MISEIYILFFKASLTIRHTATLSQKKSGTSKKIQWDFQISRVGSLDFLDLKVNGSPDKKRENLEYYFITCICPKIKLKSGFRISCSVRRKLFEEATTTALIPNHLLGILIFLGFLKGGGGFKRCNSHVTAYIFVLKFL